MVLGLYAESSNGIGYLWVLENMFSNFEKVCAFLNENIGTCLYKHTELDSKNPENNNLRSDSELENCRSCIAMDCCARSTDILWSAMLGS